jgi:hypothetical protein
MFKILLDLCRQELFSSGGCHGKNGGSNCAGNRAIGMVAKETDFCTIRSTTQDELGTNILMKDPIEMPVLLAYGKSVLYSF